MHHVHEHHHHHHHLDHELRRGRRRGEGRGPGRRGDLEARIAFLEERQRDLEQAAADIASKIQWLRDRKRPRPTSRRHRLAPTPRRPLAHSLAEPRAAASAPEAA